MWYVLAGVAGLLLGLGLGGLLYFSFLKEWFTKQRPNFRVLLGLFINNPMYRPNYSGDPMDGFWECLKSASQNGESYAISDSKVLYPEFVMRKCYGRIIMIRIGAAKGIKFYAFPADYQNLTIATDNNKNHQWLDSFEISIDEFRIFTGRG